MLREFYSRKLLCAFLITLLSATLSYSQTNVGYMELISSSQGLSQPIELHSAPGDPAGRFFIVQKTGEIMIWDNGSVLSTPFLNINPLVEDNGEQGLLSMAFHPQYATNGFFYVYYNANNGNVTVARYQRSSNPDIADPTPTPATPLANISKPFDNHNGGHLQFRVEGGVNYLYFATGDGGSGNDPFNNAQNPSSLLGKMLRINVDAPTPVLEIWGRGLRNPFRWSFDRATGDMWIADVGQGSREEINYLPATSVSPNFGWPCREGFRANASAPGAGDCDTVTAVAINPIFDYPTGADSGRSVIGGYVYRGAAFPSLVGTYLMTDYFSNRVLAIRSNGSGGWSVTEVTPTPVVSNIASISEGADGELYAISLTGNAIYRIIVPVVTPLVLTQFSAKPFTGYNELNWTTASEQDIDRFTIEYGKNGMDFITIGDVAATNNTITKNYRFLHQISTREKAFYRLRINERSNSHSYSAVIVVNGVRTKEVKVYPTLVKNSLLNVVSGFPVEKLRISSLSGQEVYSKDLNGADGFFSIGLPSLQKGFYVVSVVGKGEQFTAKILIE
ncbi:MAG: hypothetical protein DI535_02095 [Citrobacter freundii]|nr:MAG: hypothetical protein DI535_02095 [Citrobacter freundii]